MCVCVCADCSGRNVGERSGAPGVGVRAIVVGGKERLYLEQLHCTATVDCTVIGRTGSSPPSPLFSMAQQPTVCQGLVVI
jgi:hypothetical protein